MSKRRVVVTGLGMLTPLGNTVADTWQKLTAGESGIGYIQRFDTEAFGVKIGGELKDLDISKYMDRKEARRMDPFMQYGLIAVAQAVQDASLDSLSDDQKKRTGVAMGSGIGGVETIENVRDTFVKSGPRKVTPFFCA
jgi:3-oxoacyl-[acyl-carrier-protein] synthase II